LTAAPNRRILFSRHLETDGPLVKSAARERRKIAGDARRVVVKIGSSLITDGRQLSAEKIDALAETVSRHHGEGREMLITSSGAIAAGMAKLGLSRRPQNIPEKQAAAAIGQSYLMWAYERAFSRRGCQVAQILLTRDEFSFRKRYLNARNTLFTLLAHRVVPIVNENDSVAVEEIQVGDNDSLSATVACLAEADLLLILSDVEGLFTADPRCEDGACLIPSVREITGELLEAAGEAGSGIGTGGMYTKLLAAQKVMDFGIPMVIADGRDPGAIDDVLAGREKGTLFVPPRRKMAGRKHWILHSIPPQGRVDVDAGAARAVLKGGKSLLPAGITGVKGEFSAGDAVRVVGPDGNEVARGLVNYGSADVTRIKGLHTDQVRLVLGYAYDEVIHRDDLVLVDDRI
jgi:glutamate 5-kinase